MKKVLFYGDSNTYGYDPAGFMGGRYPRAVRWTTILQENLKNTWQILADGMPGRALPLGSYEWGYLRSVIRQSMPLDLFAVMLGTNDILGTVHPDAAAAALKMNDLISFVKMTAAEAEEDPAVRRTVSGTASAGRTASENTSVREAGEAEADSGETPQAALQILLIAPPKIELIDQSFLEPYVCGDRSFSQMYREEGRRLTQFYRRLADDWDILFADASQWDLPFAHDGVHLSAEGHAAFAAEMTKVFRCFLRI